MYEKYLKRIIDFIFALLLLIITSPILLICGIAIKLESEGPILFKQRRIGKDNKEFLIYKMRTMTVEIENKGKELTDSVRLTKVGKFLRKTSLDEIPQCINIVKGEMSFIGPRPLPVIYLPYYTKEEIHRHDVRPGISGWAQVNGRNYLSWEDRFIYDLEYVKNISFIFDLKILILTIKKVITKSDVGVRGVDFKDISLHEIREPRENHLEIISKEKII